MLQPSLFARFNQRIPRYTSYPTAPFFAPMRSEEYAQELANLEGEIALYIHIPFCRKMCLFCACSVILNRSEERQALYVETLLQEIRLVRSKIKKNVLVKEVHFGGGTPTNLTEEQFSKIFSTLQKTFSFAKGSECSIEIDPRTVTQKKSLPFLRTYFDRVSFGVQDLNPEVQEAILRRQSGEMTQAVFHEARKCGFLGINLDLIYGLPKQTPASFQKTANMILELKPDRIALFSYAKVPLLKPHQKAIREEDLPEEQDKWRMYIETRKTFTQGGYVAIGMDHFARREDPLAKAYFDNTLERNFQGYRVKRGKNMLGFGVSSIGLLNELYVQNTKDIALWTEKIEEKLLPIEKGKKKSFDDQKRYEVIQKIMCKFSYHFSPEEQAYFSKEIAALRALPELLIFRNDSFVATPLGRVFIRNIASVFDAYLQGNPSKQYSQSL